MLCALDLIELNGKDLRKRPIGTPIPSASSAARFQRGRSKRSNFYTKNAA
jgi:hypothetical protein